MVRQELTRSVEIVPQLQRKLVKPTRLALPAAHRRF